jgi:two-component system NtrC family sensor kinase
MLRDGTLLGAFCIRRSVVQPFTDRQIQLLETFVDQAVIAIENARLFEEREQRNTELQDSNRQVTEALEQQTATASILRVIASSPTDIQTVLDTITESATRLCDGGIANIHRIDDQNNLYLAAVYASDPSAAARPWSTNDRRPISETTVTGCAVFRRQTLHVEDLASAIETDYPDSRRFQHAVGHRTILSTPLLREGEAIGAITIGRRQVRPFSAREIDLVETFADQAVIAIENARLFQELEQRNAQLNEALEQQTVTADVLRVIASSPTNLNAVLSTLSESAARLCGASGALLWRVQGEVGIPVAAFGELSQRIMDARGAVPLVRESLVGRVVIDRRTIHISNLAPLLETEFPACAFRTN